MQQYRTAIVREILFQIIPISVLALISCILIIVVFFKSPELHDVKGAKLITFGSVFFIVAVCGLIMFFGTKELFIDLKNDDFVEYYGEAVYEKSNKEFCFYRLNDGKETVVYSGKIAPTINVLDMGYMHEIQNM